MRYSLGSSSGLWVSPSLKPATPPALALRANGSLFSLHPLGWTHCLVPARRYAGVCLCTFVNLHSHLVRDRIVHSFHRWLMEAQSQLIHSRSHNQYEINSHFTSSDSQPSLLHTPHCQSWCLKMSHPTGITLSFNSNTGSVQTAEFCLRSLGRLPASQRGML